MNFTWYCALANETLDINATSSYLIPVPSKPPNKTAPYLGGCFGTGPGKETDIHNNEHTVHPVLYDYSMVCLIHV